MELSHTISTPRWMRALQFTVGGAGALGVVFALLNQEYIIALAILGVTIALAIALLFALKSDASASIALESSPIDSGLAVTAVGVVALIVGTALWLYSGTAAQSVGLFIGGFGFITGGIVANRIRRSS